MLTLSSSSDPRKLLLLSRCARVLALVVLGVAAFVLAAWLSNSVALIELVPGHASMKANTALGLICCAAALYLVSMPEDPSQAVNRWRWVATGLALLSIVLGVLTVLEYVLGVDLHIDQLFLRDLTRPTPSYIPGRMAPITAANFVFIGSALLSLATRRAARLTQLLAGCSGFLSLVIMTGTSYGIEALIGQLTLTGVAVQTNFCFMLLFAGIFCATGERGAMRLLIDTGSAGKLLRRLLPTAVLVPLVFSSGTAVLVRAGLIHRELGISLFCITTIVAFTVLVWWSGSFLRRSEARSHQADLRLNESLRRYQFLADAMPEMVWTAKPDGSVEYFNQRWLQYTGQTLEEAKSWGWKVVLHPDDLPRCLDRWNESLKTGRGYEIDYRLKAKDGTYRWFLGRAYALHDERGAVTEWVGNCADIDDQKRARQQLEQRVTERTAEVEGARLRLQSVLDSATQVAVIAVDAKGTIQLFNRGAEQMFGYEPAELVGKQTPSIFHVEWELVAHTQEVSQRYGRPLHGFDALVEDVRQGRHESREWTFVRKDGARFPGTLMVTAMRDNAGGITGFLGIVNDISARKKGRGAVA